MNHERQIVHIVLNDIVSSKLLELLESGGAIIIETPYNEGEMEKVLPSNVFKESLGELTTFPCSGVNSDDLQSGLEILDSHYNDFTEFGDWNEVKVWGDADEEILSTYFGQDTCISVEQTPYGARIFKI
jgi:hypothetical protein